MKILERVLRLMEIISLMLLVIFKEPIVAIILLVIASIHLGILIAERAHKKN